MVGEAPNGRSFTVRDLVAAVERTERETRGRAVWFGEVDVHHMFFEEIRPTDDGRWRVFWGS